MINSKFSVMFTSCVTTASLAVTSLTVASPIIVQPTEAASQDTFVYRFLPNMPIGNTPGFDALLASGRAGEGFHDLRSFVRFDLTGVSIGPAEVATINLFVTDTTAAGFGANPSVAQPVITDLFPVTTAWNETISWNTQPGVAPLAASRTIDSINRWVSFDVTNLVTSWLNDPSSNNGVALLQRDSVGGPAPSTSVVAAYESASGANRPYLEVRAVPEPTVALCALMTSLASRRRRN